jgi:Neurotransmitter-gated ion-channel ligand binding domain
LARNEPTGAVCLLSHRLARPGAESERLIGSELDSRLNEIWSPDLQFVNAVETKTFNQALTLHPDGTVEHRIDLLGRFSPMDFRRFPFDTQSLNIGIESFMERIDRLKFIPEWGRTRGETDSASGDFMLTGVHPTVTPSSIRGWNENFSHYQLALAVERDVSFYVWHVIVPTSIIVMISFALFFVDISSYHDRVGIAMTCLLACVATQFAISFSLPRIGYLTPIDRFFVWTYIAIAVGVAISTVVKVLEGRGDPRWKILDYHARWVSPLIFFAGIAGVLAF